MLTGADRGQLVFLQTALAQHPNRLEAVLVVADPPAYLVPDWNLGRVRLVRGTGVPGLQLLSKLKIIKYPLFFWDIPSAGFWKKHC